MVGPSLRAELAGWLCVWEQRLVFFLLLPVAGQLCGWEEDERREGEACRPRGGRGVVGGGCRVRWYVGVVSRGSAGDARKCASPQLAVEVCWKAQEPTHTHARTHIKTRTCLGPCRPVSRVLGLALAGPATCLADVTGRWSPPSHCRPSTTTRLPPAANAHACFCHPALQTTLSASALPSTPHIRTSVASLSLAVVGGKILPRLSTQSPRPLPTATGHATQPPPPPHAQ